MKAPLYLLIISLFLLVFGCKRKNEDLTLRIYFPFSDTLELKGNKVFLFDNEKDIVVDSVNIDTNGYAMFTIKRPRYPVQMYVKYRDKSHPGLYRLLGFWDPYTKLAIKSFFYIYDKHTNIVAFSHLFSKGTKDKSFQGSEQNEPFFKDVRLKYDEIGNAREEVFAYNKSTIGKYPNSKYLLSHLNLNKAKFDSVSLVKLLGLFDKSLTNANDDLAIRFYLQNKSIIDKGYPTFRLQDSSGIYRRVFESGKRYEMLVFWASWCIPCRKEIPSIKALFSRHRYQLDISYISVDWNISSWKQAMADESMPWKQLWIGQSRDTVSRSFLINGIPKLYLFKDQQLVLNNAGYDTTTLYRIDSLLSNR